MPKKQKISDFRPQSKNANRHTERGLGMLDRSMSQEGWIGAITVAADGETFDGSARLETAYTRFGEDVEPIIVESDGTKPIIVKRTDIPTAEDPRAKRLAIAANRVAQVDLEWDVETLSALQDDGIDLLQFWRDDELDRLLGQEVDDVNYDELWEGMPEFNQNNADAPYSVKVNFYNLEDIEEFSRIVGQTVTEKTKFINFPAIEKENLKACIVRDES